jgi:hypothetical protein
VSFLSILENINSSISVKVEIPLLNTGFRMKDYWNQRFRREGKIWGGIPSSTAIYAKELFIRNKIKKILIPGVGYGRNAKYFVGEGFDVTGIEISEEALKLSFNCDFGIRYYRGSVLDMPFNTDLYDAIYCFNVLHLFLEDDRKLFIKKSYDQIIKNGLVFFTVFSEKESSFGKGREVEINTFESKPGRPIHYFTEQDLKDHFIHFNIIEAGIIEDFENHGEEGPHIHLIRYIFGKKLN